MPPKSGAQEFYVVDGFNVEPGDIINALKALTEGKLNVYLQIGKDSLGKAHAFRFANDPKMKDLEVLAPGDEELLLSTLASRFNKSFGRVRYDLETQDGVLCVFNAKGDRTANTYKNEALPAFPGRLFERSLTWAEPVWMGSGPPAGRPERPAANTPGYDKPLEPGSYIGAFQKLAVPALEALRQDADRTATGELTFKADDGAEARIWFESGIIVGVVFDPYRGEPLDKQWDAILKEPFSQRRFRINVPRPEHIGNVKPSTPKLLGRK